MFTSVRNAITRLVMPVLWRRDPEHASRMLKNFAETEFDSGWQYLNALAHTSDPSVRRMLFSNVLEEFRHSDYFSQAAHMLASRRLRSPAQSRTTLVKAPSDLPAFLAYAHESERAIHQQFATYAKSCSFPAVSEVFLRICDDEEDHHVEAKDSLSSVVGSSSSVRRLVLRARAKRALEAWTRGSKRVGDTIFYLLLSAVFFAFGPFLGRRKALATKGAAATASNVLDNTSAVAPIR